MKITVFQSDKGDCLLLEGRDGGCVLADGGMPDTYTRHVSPHLNKMRENGRKLDAVYVSHIDEDHIAGILQMMDDEVEWRIFDYQTGIAKNGNARRPESLRPPEVDCIWHNAFHEQVSDNNGDIEDVLAATVAVLAGGELQKYVRMAEYHQEVATSIRQAMSLSRRIDEGQLDIKLNPQSKGKLMMLRRGKKAASIKIGSMDWTLIGPMPADLADLRAEWNAWVKKNRKTIGGIQEKSRKTEKLMGNSLPNEVNKIVGVFAAQADHLGGDLLSRIGPKKQMVLGVRRKVTVPNLASLMFFVEERDGDGRKRTVLMSGDGHWEDILKGMEATGKIKKNATLHVDVLKGPHHLSEHNTNRDFYKRVIADHYVTCANGGHENPDVDVVRAILDSRLDPKHQGDHPRVSEPFTLWFNSSSSDPDADAKNRVHMKKVEDLVAKKVEENMGRVEAFFLQDSFFEITI